MSIQLTGSVFLSKIGQMIIKAMSFFISFVHCTLSAQAVSNQKIVMSLSPGQAVANAILHPYFERSDREARRVKEYIRDNVDKKSVTIQCWSDDSVAMENSDKIIERQCEKKDADCCLMLVMKNPKSAPKTAVDSINESCFVKNNPTACFVVMSIAKKTAEAEKAADKGCDLNSYTLCLVKASILYGLRKDVKSSLSIFENLCRNQKYAFSCYMASIHYEKVVKNKSTAAGLMKEACNLGFKYNCHEQSGQ